ncbi:hypothetical protein M501DRAFT_227828 [Patellaria atrata CBS 101060]|uniref:Uncharacterized protein n=1 Tax=Patellaria atrata CBS 101060 TaxID=1346257 RepID=A0A9P4VNY5_9PEZI|nr:hypothetical protein M501DRAFT_227828 [Patellaria atrata CBS 101060]
MSRPKHESSLLQLPLLYYILILSPGGNLSLGLEAYPRYSNPSLRDTIDNCCIFWRILSVCTVLYDCRNVTHNRFHRPQMQIYILRNDPGTTLNILRLSEESKPHLYHNDIAGYSKKSKKLQAHSQVSQHMSSLALR